MDLFFSLCVKIIPYYLIIACGFLAARYYEVRKESIANLTIYIIAPAVMLIGTLEAGLKFNILILPFCFLAIGSCLCLGSYFLSRYVWQDNTRMILAFTCGTANVGYFGIPVCLAIAGPDALPVAVMFSLGSTLYENSLGYYVAAQAEYSGKEALRKLLVLPGLYAFVVGILLNLCQVQLYQPLQNTLQILKGAYSPLGMMIIGMGLAQVKWEEIDYKFMAFSFVNKFLVWPLFGLLFIYCDHFFFHLWEPFVQKVFLIQMLVPLAANTVAFASRFHAYPEKAAVAVTVSTLLALAIVPLVMSYVLNLLPAPLPLK
jgi:predicted permease